MHIYRPNSRFKAPVNKEKCKSAVPDGGRSVGFHQCGRKAAIDGWCKQHHPDEVQKRHDVADAVYKAEAKVLDERAKLNRAAPAMAKALGDLLAAWIELADSGDAGHWDTEKDPLVIAARAALPLAGKDDER